MIRTKWLDVKYGITDYKDIDDLINEFIEENPIIKIIDIKYQSNISAVADSGVSATYSAAVRGELD